MGGIMSLRRKDIQPGQYWNVKYSNYEGPVLVKEECPYHPNEDKIRVWSCVIPENLGRPYVNYLSGSRFAYKDFRTPATEAEFWMARVKWLKKELNKSSGKISKLRKLKKQQQPVERISWKTIAFQERINRKIWEWASPYSKGLGVTLGVVICYIANLPNNDRKVQKSLEEIKKLDKLPEKVAVKKARSYLNSRHNS